MKNLSLVAYLLKKILGKEDNRPPYIKTLPKPHIRRVTAEDKIFPKFGFICSGWFPGVADGRFHHSWSDTAEEAYKGWVRAAFQKKWERDDLQAIRQNNPKRETEA